MDCDKFERVLLSHLYGELDELTRAGASRHADQCRRCQQLWQRFKTTREIGTLPLLDPPENFEQRVLEAERQVHLGLPWGVRLSRSLTIVGGYAMRPQLAMAALALLMIGSSLVLLRPRPRSPSSPVTLAAEGAPRPEPEAFVVPVEAEPEPVADEPEEAPLAPAVSATSSARPRAENSAPTASNESPQSAEAEIDAARARAEDRAYAAAMSAFRAADHAQAQQQFDSIVEAGGRNAAAAELYAALAAEQAQGCSAALPRFDSVAAKYGASNLGHMATWHSAICRTKLGHDRRAVLDFQKLLKVPAYAERARKSLGLVGTEGAADVVNDSPVAASVPGAIETPPGTLDPAAAGAPAAPAGATASAAPGNAEPAPAAPGPAAPAAPGAGSATAPGRAPPASPVPAKSVH